MTTSTPPLFILAMFFLQTCDAISCSSSSCGLIRNISFPFRLKHDPKHCGHPDYELECENNATTILYLNSHKHQVKAINYHNFTIRVVDDSIDSNNTCSFPNYSTHEYNFSRSYYPYSVWKYGYFRHDQNNEVALPINFMSCTHQLSNSSLYTDLPTDQCASNSWNSRHGYVKVGHMNVTDVQYTCRIDLMAMTSWKFKNSSVSLLEIHHSLLYGFELSWFMYPCSKCRIRSGCSVGENHTATCIGISPYFPALMAVLIMLVVVFGGVSIPAKIIFGFACVFGLHLAGWQWPSLKLFSTWDWDLDLYRFSFDLEMLFANIGFVLIARFIILFPFFMGLVIYKFRRRHLSVFDAIENFLRSDNKLMPIRYSYSDINRMSAGFRQKLGQGGYGSVYKGKLRSGHHVAVKLLANTGANDRDFMNEIATIGRIHHVNVVTLVGYCAERSKRALVYDFMPQGSLEKYILRRHNGHSLDWTTKYKIAVGVAKGIEYLHRGCNIQILHFDIKPHNILLDDKFVPKISDFGLAKFCSTDKNTVTLTAARGTVGYVAPELMNRGFGEVSYKADVYSFGMLLIEMVGLKRDLKGEDENSSQYFPDWIYECFDQGKDIEFEKSDEEQSEETRKIGRKMAIVALWCIQMRPDDRPSMNKVREMLEGEIEELQIPKYSSLSPQVEVVLDMDQSLSSSIAYDFASSLEISVDDI